MGCWVLFLLCVLSFVAGVCCGRWEMGARGHRVFWDL